MNIHIDLEYPEVCYECPILHWGGNPDFPHCTLYMSEDQAYESEVWFDTSTSEVVSMDKVDNDKNDIVITYRRNPDCRLNDKEE